MAVLKLNDISLTYQTPESETEALKNVSFTVDNGQFVSLVGPSGCGKTTILSVVAGLIKPTSGNVTVDGKPASSKNGDVGYMLQRDSLLPWRTIEDNVMIGLEILKKNTPENRKYALSLVEKYGLSAFLKHYPSGLSGGMRQRVALIRTLAFKPKTLLLDEPFSALDFQTRLSVCDDVRDIIRQEGVTTLLVTHDISEAVAMSDRILVLTPRPATVKLDYSVEVEGDTPLKRRENSQFSRCFDTIWKEVKV